MEERQTQIREGAGLEESKLNVEFIEWLRRWSTPLLGVIALVALGFVVANRIERGRQAAVDKAFEEFETASRSASPNPETLKTVAAENSGVRAVPSLAELEAADLYLRAARLGLRLGAKPNDKGEFPAEEQLAADQRDTYLNEADRLYKSVLDRAGSDPKKAVIALPAAFGVAAIAEARGKLEEAKQAYQRAESIAGNAGFATQAAVAKKRIDNVSTLAEPRKLLTAAELPKPPEPPKSPTDPNQPATANPAAPVYTPSPVPASNPEPPGTTPPGTTPSATTPPATPPATAPESPKPASPATPEAPKPAEPKPAEPK